MIRLFSIILLFFVVSFISCRKDDFEPTPQPKKEIDIFSQVESEISDGDKIMFNLTSDSTYVIKLVDKTTSQVISKEKIKGNIGANKLIIYTKSLQTKYLYIVLEDLNKKELNKTTLIVK